MLSLSIEGRIATFGLILGRAKRNNRRIRIDEMAENICWVNPELAANSNGWRKLAVAATPLATLATATCCLSCVPLLGTELARPERRTSPTRGE